MGIPAPSENQRGKTAIDQQAGTHFLPGRE